MNSGNERKKFKSEMDEMRAKLDNLQQDVTEIKSALLSGVLLLRSINEKLNSNPIERPKARIQSDKTSTQNSKLNNGNISYDMNESTSSTVNSVFEDANGRSNGQINGQANVQANFQAIDSNKFSNKVYLYQGSSIMVDDKRLESAINAGNKSKNNKHAMFINKIFTAVCGLRDVYRKSRSGTAPRIKTENCVEKKKFSKQLTDELINASKFYFGQEINRDQVKKTITDKLQSLNFFLLKLKENPDACPKSVTSKVSEEDLACFAEYELFKNNPSLFDQLDQEFNQDYEGSIDQSNVDCILDCNPLEWGDPQQKTNT